MPAPARLAAAAAAVAALCGATTAVAESSTAAPRPHIISILQDDLGWYDSGLYNPAAVAFTHNITALARDGIVLGNMYTHWHCSPTRRSFLTGRLPIHHGEQLSSNGGDDIDLRMTWISEKLAGAGYEAHWFGKMHTGFRSFRHLGFQHNFTRTSIGSLQTGGPYSGPSHTTRWQGDHPVWRDAQFVNPPTEFGCNATASAVGLPHGVDCDPAHFLPDTELPCGDPVKFTNETAPAACCATCQATEGCTHWVYDPSGVAVEPHTRAVIVAPAGVAAAHGDDDSRSLGAKGNCHLKAGKDACNKKTPGVTSGRAPAPPGPSPGPSPGPGGALCTDEYSTDLWGQMALQAVAHHDLANPLYVHLCFEAVHVPYDKAPGDPTNNTYHGLLWRADVFIGQLVMLLKARGMYNNTLILYSSDNGGTTQGINFPLRGEKHSNWEGGMRAAAFVSGGFVPEALRGTTDNHTTHIVDWYPTFAALAGATPTDDPPVAPLPADVNDPYKNIYGEHSFPPVDGTNLWPILTEPEKYPAVDAVHPNGLVLTKEVLIDGQYKLLVSQPHFKSQQHGWKQADGTWRDPFPNETFACMKQDAAPDAGPNGSPLPVPGEPGASPCLFDLSADPNEHVDLSAQHPDVVQKMWADLNLSIAGQRDCQGWSYHNTPGGIPGPLQPDNTTSCSPPELIGTCNAPCANAKWAAMGKADGPICGVPGCD